MGDIVRAGIPQWFERSDTAGVTTLNVALTVRNKTTVVPDVIIPMPHEYNGTYAASFIPSANQSYLVMTTVFTDNTYSTPDPDYPNGSTTVYAENSSSAAAIASAVWDEPLSSHLTPGTTGEKLSKGAQGAGGAEEIIILVDESLDDQQVQIDEGNDDQQINVDETEDI